MDLTELQTSDVEGIDKVYLMDFSSNGVFINDKRIQRKTWTDVNENDVVRLGESSRTYMLKTGKKDLIAEIIEDPDALALVPVKKKKAEHIPTKEEIEAKTKLK